MNFMPELPLYELKKSDIPAAKVTLIEAFAKDPLFGYIMGSDDYDRKKTGHIHNFILQYGMKYGKVYAASSKIEGVAVWLPPGQTTMTFWRLIRSGVLSVRKIMPANVLERPGFISRLLKYANYTGKIHKKYAPFPHWYLLIIGVADEYRGKGFASLLIRPLLDQFDRQGLPCYLETHNPLNIAKYEHYGFKIVDIGKLPGTDKPQWTMLRPGK